MTRMMPPSTIRLRPNAMPPKFGAAFFRTARFAMPRSSTSRSWYPSRQRGGGELATQQACETRAAPVPAAERIDSLDALRGLALLGVLAMNLETWFPVCFFQQFVPRAPDPGLDGW